MLQVSWGLTILNMWVNSMYVGCKRKYLFFVAVSITILGLARPTTASVQFTEDAILSLNGISEGDLYIASTSQCASLAVSGSGLTVSDIPDGSDFILKTPEYEDALKLTPSGGTVSLTFESAHLDTLTGTISQWTLTGSGTTRVIHTVGVPQANTYYSIKADGTALNSYQSNVSGEVNFTYAGGFSSKVFTIEQDLTAPTNFDLTSPVNYDLTSDTTPTFSWNASDAPDLDHYELYIDGSLNTDDISGTSITLSNSLPCSNKYTWYVKAVDSAGNSVESDSTFDITIECPSGGGRPSSQHNAPRVPAGGFKVSINKGVSDTNSRQVTLNLAGGADAARMAISNSSDFTYAIQEPYVSIKEWDLCQGLATCVAGHHTVYVRFYTPLGTNSETISDSINLVLATDFDRPFSDMTVEELQTLLNTILERIAQLKVQLNQIQTITPTDLNDCQFNMDLRYGSSGIQVRCLQMFLNQYQDTRLAESGPGSLGNETDYFRQLTHQAVVKFQEKYATDILIPWRLVKGTGFVGQTTRAKINELLGK